MDALRFLNEKSPQKEEGEASVFKVVIRELASIMPDANPEMVLNLQDADLLQAALTVYLEEGDIRPGGDRHKEGTDLRYALGDYIDTQMEVDFPKMLQSIVECTEYFKNLGNKLRGIKEETPEDFENGVKQKRDDIFKEIIGTPETLNIWGERAKPKLSKKELRARAKTTFFTDGHLPGYRDRVVSIKQSDEAIVAIVRKNAYVPEPLADAEVDQDLTGGDPCRFNERMQTEGRKFIQVGTQVLPSLETGSTGPGGGTVTICKKD